MEEHQDKHMIGGIMSIVSGACGVLGMVTIIFVILFIRYTLNKVTHACDFRTAI